LSCISCCLRNTKKRENIFLYHSPTAGWITTHIPQHSEYKMKWTWCGCWCAVRFALLATKRRERTSVRKIKRFFLFLISFFFFGGRVVL
jgi:hypothetical protein